MAMESDLGIVVDEGPVASYELEGLGAKLQDMYASWKTSREDMETQWLKDMRQFVGTYDSEIAEKIKQSGKKSEVFVGLTRTKVMAAYSKIIDLLFQRGDKPYSIEATPVPNIPHLKETLKKKAITELLLAANTTDPMMIMDLVEQRSKEIEAEVNKVAEERAEKMERQIADQTAEGELERKLKESILEMCILGSCAFKAGTVRMERESHWMNEPALGHVLMIEEKPVPEIESVSIFDLYPDPYASSVDDADGIFRRHVLTKSQLRKLKGVPGFNSDEIERLIAENRLGNHVEHQHEVERRSLNKQANNLNDSRRFEVLEYWGMVDGQDLSDCGCEVGEEFLSVELEANVWFINGTVIKAQLNPLPRKRIPYFICPYEKLPHQMWGVSIPRMMRDSQVTINAASRMMIDNAAISSGPMVEVNNDLLAAGEDPTRIYPWRVFIREGGDPQAPMVRFYQAQSNVKEVSNLLEMFRRFADETTSLPSYTHGMQSDALNSTATGVSMLMGAANISLKSVIKNLDDYLVRPMIQALYDWNMEFSDDEDIKGDMKVVARGSTALIQKEIQSQRLLQFMSIAGQTPVAQLVNWETLMKDVAKSLEIDAERAIISQETQQKMAEEQAMQQMAMQQQMAAEMGPPPGMPPGMMPGPQVNEMPPAAPPPPDGVMVGRGANGGLPNG